MSGEHPAAALVDSLTPAATTPSKERKRPLRTYRQKPRTTAESRLDPGLFQASAPKLRQGAIRCGLLRPSRAPTIIASLVIYVALYETQKAQEAHDPAPPQRTGPILRGRGGG
ncbi:aa864bed-bc4f-4fcb-b42c-a85160de0961 [Thermothielavioides terrestris]|uniref:Aa864bed-bc4f-4fcb-b42c-a85160de0961 n=1 Tax=Thermothielavioides terrestris TaxID=2587410 RepID=A0A446BQN5_9PEZI|nr:aa864bed-bc4f-4fcb-b42c-a85160de0961 [Thermothielavioides terrestris]